MSRFRDIIRQLRREPDVPALPEPGFAELNAAESDIIRVRLRRPILAGSIVVLVLVFGLLIWAAFSTLQGAVVAQGTVRVENNSKVLKTREGGIVRQILVREGQAVRRGQVLMRMDAVQVQATVDVWQAQYDSALADIARFQAMLANAPDIRFPQDLLSRQGDPRVAALIAGQRALFESEMLLYRSQADALRGQAGQMQTQIQGLRAQASATDAQSATIVDELGGVRELNQLGYAPKTRVLALERSRAQLTGQRGSLTADMARTQQGIGNVRIQLAQLEQKRADEAATGIRAAQDKLTDAAPKLRATSESLSQTVIRAPADGRVFGLTQYTEGGVAQPGETLLQVVPTGTPLVIQAQVRPEDIARITPGMKAEVNFTAFNPRTTPPADGYVATVSADAATAKEGGQPFYQVEVRVDAAEVARLGEGMRLTPGMQAHVNIVTGSRTILDYLLGPYTEAMRSALRER
ncbi:HlyD family type I secretion periplasmic adaptor subunit [uncultured Sphingomonas sp.]|uniref:HlyD family type I secretion periplasmic adaptor subunit n=1 Tax=uncultured Sphingomonas sp. TaxID=158754 RepID=UPI0026001FA7|nr:HlyD family type I secretion periplasmic adaptor subunit [uncultured Sphingomonas sp.]